jgi:hypothetical protein
MFVVRQHELEILPGVISSWRKAFSSWGDEAPEVCVWVTGQGITGDEVNDVCLHTLELSPSIDFYARSPLERKPWSPWGLKSGPNYQFFHILREMSKIHDSKWLLQLESDTVALREVGRDDIPGEENDAWMVGASADYGSGILGKSSTSGHINGAAFYRVGSPEFMIFLDHTWSRSLLFMTSRRPALAYDSITSPELWRELPEGLALAWEQNKLRFRVEEYMVNLSNKMTNVADPSGQLKIFAPEIVRGKNPWFLHLAKLKK